ncbi:MAG TPA: hypothetical protein VE127_03605 [Solirubrobacteraceae bacterium]|nr:hypothetical protein [Solirubrobacteraceae bacterium]
MTTNEYLIGLSFSTEGDKQPIHVALQQLTGVTVKAASLEEAEAQADQILHALEAYANHTGRTASAPVSREVIVLDRC